MNKVSIFIDGKNFYSGWRDTKNPVKINFSRMVSWLSEQVSADQLAGAFYYTGVETENTTNKNQKKLLNFLDSLQNESHFTVRKFPKKIKHFECSDCGKEHIFLQEKDTETFLVSDMLELAAKKKTDSIILISGNSTFAQALSVAKELGVKVYVASWDEVGMSQKLSALADGHINLMDGVKAFELKAEPQQAAMPGVEDFEDVEEDEETIQANNNALMDELRKAEKKFNGGYVGLNYFINRWASVKLDNDPVYRRDIIDDLVEDGLVEIYAAPDGKEAVRLKPHGDTEATRLSV